jgi:TonB family protein
MDSVRAAPGLPNSQMFSDRESASWQAASVSAGLHGFLLAALCFAVAPRHVTEPPPPPSFAVVMAPPDALPVAEQSLAEATLTATAQSLVTRLAAPVTLSVPPSLRGEIPSARIRQHAVAAAPPAPAQAAVAAPAARMAAPVAPAAAPAHAAATVPHDVIQGLEARIRQAVQDAAIYPASARVMHLEGRTQVRFDYTDGSVGVADVSTPSTSAMLDRAALAAVRRAALPRAPAEVGKRTLPLLVWVDFRLVQQD